MRRVQATHDLIDLLKIGQLEHAGEVKSLQNSKAYFQKMNSILVAVIYPNELDTPVPIRDKYCNAPKCIFWGTDV